MPRQSMIVTKRSDTKDGILHDHVLYNLTEAGGLIGLSPSTISRLVREGHLSAFKGGLGQRRILGLHIRRYLGLPEAIEVRVQGTYATAEEIGHAIVDELERRRLPADRAAPPP